MFAPMRYAVATAAVCALCCPLFGASVTLTFDDLSPATHEPLSNGYQGFNWDNFRVLNTHWYDPKPSGFKQGAVSGNNLAFNYQGNDAWMSRVGGAEFDFVSAWLISGWRIDLDLDVVAYRDGAIVDQTTINDLSNQASAQYAFNFLNIDALHFHAYGGAADSTMAYSSTGFGMDDVVLNDVPTVPPNLVPEPMTVLALLLSAGGVAGYVRRRAAV
ncbi:MAG TPA: PEP-CTERM sorting domain-containing protein [Phycisphaerae bacterium]|nr:PEP-CTERM sorting domain-containing protein [Phycisphaerae bacterium]